MSQMYYVYKLRSVNNPRKIYIGCAKDLLEGFLDHSNGSVQETKDYRPWDIEFYMAFDRKESALAFERYLKSATGRAFIRRHLSQYEKSIPDKMASN